MATPWRIPAVKIGSSGATVKVRLLGKTETLKDKAADILGILGGLNSRFL
jgi:hypothetical protein